MKFLKMNQAITVKRIKNQNVNKQLIKPMADSLKKKSNKIDNSDHMLRKPKKAQVNNIRNERLKTKDIVV